VLHPHFGGGTVPGTSWQATIVLSARGISQQPLAEVTFKTFLIVSMI
jgi:hypothetical protein